MTDVVRECDGCGEITSALFDVRLSGWDTALFCEHCMFDYIESDDLSDSEKDDAYGRLLGDDPS